MGLLDIAFAAARVGFSVAGDVKKTVVIKTGPTGTHNTTTDQTTVTWQHTTTLTDAALVYDVEEQEMSDGTSAPKKKSKTVFVQAIELPAPPTEESRVTYDGADWEVVSVETDPAGATHTLTIRS